MISLISRPRLITLVSLMLVPVILFWFFFTGTNNDNTIFDERTAHFAGPFKVHVQLNPQQPKVGDNMLTIILYGKDNQPVTDANIVSVAEMPAMGSMPAMQAPATMKHNGAGVYVGSFELSMTGAWPLSLKINSVSSGLAALSFDLTTSREGLRLTDATPSMLSPISKQMNAGISAESGFTTAGPYRIRVIINPDPPQVGKNTIIVTITDKNKQPISGAKVRAVAQMPAMGSMATMNSPAEIIETTQGKYEGSFELGKRGEWSMAVDIETAQLGHGDLTFDMATGREGITLATATPGDISHYTCSMHPSVKSATPGTCPICAMNLVSVTKKEMRSGSIRMDARRRQLIGVTTEIAENKPMNQIIRAAGRVTYDETRLTDITLKFDGWIGSLYANFLGVSIEKNQPLFEVYGPDLLSAQQEYLETRRHKKNKHDTLLKAARDRLLLWDIRPAQIRQLEKRGRTVDYLPILAPISGTVIEKNIVAGSAVKAGQRLLRIADLSRVWVEGQIYEYEIPLVKVGMAVDVVLPDLSDRKITGKVAFINPYLEGETRTAKVRVELDNSNGELRPDMYAHLHLDIDLGKRLVVPESAVLYAGDSRIVFVDLGDGALQPRKIKAGLRNANVIEVLDGIEPGDKVVTSGNFLIAAESKLKAGIDQW
ncbi:Probable Co/Zn/Cd efflux system membrane fusion protein [hydrothermal vent metagenome]|uniref:Probable Co/Zn/Cd efflux system membrane fusion protein n=1 Tax=hydrothermal vent metagenome TaxID=652676 RepID=A0A3B0ZBJ4_9ZZZZ